MVVLKSKIEADESPFSEQTEPFFLIPYFHLISNGNIV